MSKISNDPPMGAEMDALIVWRSNVVQAINDLKKGDEEGAMLALGDMVDNAPPCNHALGMAAHDLDLYQQYIERNMDRMATGGRWVPVCFEEYCESEEIENDREAAGSAPPCNHPIPKVDWDTSPDLGVGFGSGETRWHGTCRKCGVRVHQVTETDWDGPFTTTD